MNNDNDLKKYIKINIKDLVATIQRRDWTWVSYPWMKLAPNMYMTILYGLCTCMRVCGVYFIKAYKSLNESLLYI